jgi:acetyltransferase
MAREEESVSGDSHFLDSFFYPKSVAVVGASQNPNTVNFYLFSNLVKLKFPGKIYPVNPNAKEIMGFKAYPNLSSIEDDIDLTVISVPANRTPGIIRDCISKRVKMISITAGGFSETGSKGKGVQDRMRSVPSTQPTTFLSASVPLTSYPEASSLSSFSQDYTSPGSTG